jgi:glycosyltransferase involved in cell wall biosynthesis
LTIGTFSKNAMMKRVKGLAPHLLAADHRVTIVAQDTAENREYFSSVEAETVFFSGSELLPEIGQKACILQRTHPDVVYACGWGLRNLPALLGSTAIVEHAELLSANRESSALNRQKNLLLEWFSVLLADGLVLASSYLLRTYQRRDVLGRTKQLHLPYGLNLEDAPAVQRRGSEGDTSRVLYMGSLYASYGIFDIVDAAAHVAETAEPVEFIVLGDGPDRQQAIEQARSLGIENHIRFEGYVDEEVLDEHLSSADVFLAPMFDTVKDKARCPSKIPMYMRYRRPIVTCRIGEIPAYLGDHGFYYSPGEPESMATQIARASRVQEPVNYDLQSVSWQHLSERFLAWLERKVFSDQTMVEVEA